MGVSNCEPFASSLEGRELLRWAAKARREGLCAGNEEHACVCVCVCILKDLHINC